MKIFYWSPFFSNVATIKAVTRSAESLIKFTQNEKYKVMLCVLAATYQGANKNRFWNHFYSFPDSKLKIDLEISMMNAGSGLKDSIKQKKKLNQVDPKLLEIVGRSNLKRFEQYIENDND